MSILYIHTRNKKYLFRKKKIYIYKTNDIYMCIHTYIYRYRSLCGMYWVNHLSRQWRMSVLLRHIYIGDRWLTVTPMYSTQSYTVYYTVYSIPYSITTVIVRTAVRETCVSSNRIGMTSNHRRATDTNRGILRKCDREHTHIFRSES